MKQHCRTCTCEPKPRLTVRRSTVRDVGACNFCSDNIGPSGFIDVRRPVYELRSSGGGGLIARVCETCMDVLREAINGHQLVEGRGRPAR